MLKCCFDPPHVIWILIAHGHLHRLIPHADAVEIAFILIYILTLCIRVANDLMRLLTYFLRLG